MTRDKGYEEYSVLNSLRRKHDIFVDTESKTIQMLWGAKAKGDVGIGTRGKIDFLVNYCRYKKMWTK